MRFNRARGEDGNVLITAILVMSLMLIFGFSLLRVVEAQQSDSRRERERESSFQVSEGALNAQIFQLSSRWPGSTSSPGSGAPYPTACSQGSANADCPSSTALGTSFANVDQSGSTAWTTQVRDNTAGSNFYDDSVLAGPSADANGDGYLWVRATAVVRGKRRTLVALVKAEQTTLNFPRATLVAGKFDTTNNGNKTIIDNDGEQNQFVPGDVIVRCSFPAGGPPATGCADYESGKGQVSPERVFSKPAQPNAVTPEALDSLRAAARADGNYYTGCPPTLQGDHPGEMVFIEDAGANCKFNGNNDYNTRAKPGYVVIGKGQIQILGNATFYGIIYHANLDNVSTYLVDLAGNVSIQGSIVIDGPGGLHAGSSKVNLVWDPNVFNNLKAFGTASIVQNTFREISASS
jgi:Tfp pilus assembly protein PilX